MSAAPSASSQAARARERANEDIKLRLESLEMQHKNEVKALTDRIHTAEGEIKDLRTSNDRLSDSVDSFRRRILNLETAKTSTDQALRVIHAKVAVEASRLDVATADLEVVAPGLAPEVVDPPEEDDGAGPSNSGSNVSTVADLQAAAREAEQKEYMNSDPVKAAVSSTLFSLYRVNNLKNIADRHYPHIPEDHEQWPHTKKPDGGRENHVRFDFELPHDSPVNRDAFERWVQAVRSQGHLRVAAAKPYLELIDDKHLRERVIMRYNWEKRKYLTAMKDVPIPTKNRPVPGESGEVPDNALEPVVDPETLTYTAEEIESMSVSLATMSTASRQGFQETKRDIRVRKRPFLTGANAIYLQSKYDAIETIGAQSEDDYEVESVNSHRPRKTGKLIARPWWFVSDEMTNCKAAIDAIPDPKPSNKRQSMPIIRGPPRPGSPRHNKKLDTRLREWMVKPSALEENPKWKSSGRVVPDHVSELDTSVTSKKRKTMEVLAASTAGPSTRGKKARADLANRQQALDQELGGGTFEDTLRDI